MKILYTLGQFTRAGHQVLFYTINNRNEPTEEFQTTLERTFNASLAPLRGMFENYESIEDMDVEPPEVGDVIWTHTSGNQYIASGIWQEEPGAEIDFGAFRLICKSVVNKAKELEQLSVSMPLLTLNDDLQLWNIVYPIIEEEFRDEDVQVIVHIPTEFELMRVLDSIGGKINRFEAEPKHIRFAKSKKE